MGHKIAPSITAARNVSRSPHAPSLTVVREDVGERTRGWAVANSQRGREERERESGKGGEIGRAACRERV